MKVFYIEKIERKRCFIEWKPTNLFFSTYEQAHMYLQKFIEEVNKIEDDPVYPVNEMHIYRIQSTSFNEEYTPGKTRPFLESL